MTKRKKNPLDGCSLEVAAQKEGSDRLRLAYTFQNGHPERNAYLFNRLFTSLDQGTFQTDPDLVYITVEKQAVVAAKKLYPVPPNMAVFYRIIPCTSRVQPGATFQESLTLPLPLRRGTPYLLGGRGDDLQGNLEQRQLAFELGYFLAHPDGDKLGKEVQTLQGPAPRFEPFPEGSQSLLRLDLTLTVPVLIE